MVSAPLAIEGSLRSSVPGYGAPEDPLSPALRGLAAGTEALKGEDLRRAARDFEAVFLRMILSSMVPEDGGGLFGEGPSAGVVRGLFVDQVGGSLAERRSLGIADLIERTMDRDHAVPGGRSETAPGAARPPAAGANSVPVDLRA